MKMVWCKVAFVPSQLDAGIIVSLLHAHGVHAMPIDCSGHVSVAGAEQGYHVEVPTKDADAAVKLLRQEGYERWLTL